MIGEFGKKSFVGLEWEEKNKKLMKITRRENETKRNKEIKKGRIHGYPSRVRVGRGHI